MKRTLITATCLAVLALVAALPAAAATSSQFASGWSVGNDANWTPFPPSAAPLGASDVSCTNSGGTPQFAEFTFPAFSIPGGDTLTGIEVVFDYLSISSSNRAQLKLSGANNGAERTIALQGGSSSCSSAVPVTAGGGADLWSSTLTVADFNAGNVSVRFLHDATTVLIDSVELRVTHAPGAPDLLPDAIDDVATVDEDSSANPIAVLGNDDLGDTPTTITAVTQPANGSAAINGTADGVEYTPSAGYCNSIAGPTDDFTYTITDNDGDPDTATVAVTVDCAPDAVDDTATVDEDSASNPIAVLGNDDLGDPAATVTAVTQPTNGSVSINGTFDGVEYTPTAGYCNSIAGPTDDFTYTVTDADGDADTATVAVTVDCAPDAVDDVATVDEDSSANPIPVLGNDDLGDTPTTITAVTQPANGSAAINGTLDGVEYTPTAGYCNSIAGPTDDFTYTITDADGDADTATVAVTVDCAPDAVDDVATVDEDSSANAIPVLGNDDLGDTPTTITAVTQPANGSAAINGTLDGVEYTPTAGYCNSIAGPTDDFTYTITDADGDADTATVAVTVDCAPDAVDDVATVDEDSSANAIPVLGNDDLGDTPTTITAVTQPANGSAAINGAADGVEYTPNPDYCNTTGGGTDDFTYTITDNDGDADTATVAVTVDCAPDAVDDTATVDEDSASNPIAVLGNDDVGDPTATVTAVTQPVNGSAAINGAADGVEYTPNADYCNTNTGITDDFTYTVTDADGDADTATVAVTVTCINDAPAFTKGADQNVAEDAGPQSVTGWATGIIAGPANEQADQSVSFNVTGNTNPGLFAAGPAVAPNGDLSYTSAADAFGIANVTITLSDDCGSGTPPASCGTTGIDTSAPQTFAITVINVNDPPSFVSGGNVITETGTGEQTLPWATAISTGPANENQAPSFTVTSNCAPSPLVADPSIDPDGTLRFTPVNLAIGTCTVSATLSDGVDSVEPVAFTLQLVLATVPVADPQTVETDGANPLAITLTGSDPDDQLPLAFQVIEPVTDADTGAIISDSGPFRGTLDTTTPNNATDTSAVVTYTPDEPTISQAAIIATDSFVLEKFADILGGDVVVNKAGGTATMERSSTTPAGFAIKADSLDVHGTATVGGDALCNAGDYVGACDLLTLPVYDLLPPFLVGSVDDGNDVNVPRKGTSNLTPGLYGDITVEPEGELVFAPGKYSMRSLTTENKTDLLFSGATEIKIAERLELGSYVEVNAGGAAGDVIFYVAGGDGSDPAAVLGFNNAVFNANVYAPNGTVSIGQDSAATGAFLGRHVVVGSKATVQLANGFGEAPDEFAFEVTDDVGLRSEQAVVEINPDDSCRDDAGQIVAIAAYAGSAATDGAASIQITLRGCESTDIPVTVTATTPGQGTLGGLPTGPVGPPYEFVVTYTPADPVPNNLDSFDFSFDNGISVATATVEINAPPCDFVEAVTPNGAATDEGNPLTITLSGCDPDDGVLAVATDDSNLNASCTSCALGTPTGPVFDTRPGHTSYEVVFTHSEVVGSTASFDYTVTGASGAATKTINVEVNPVPVAPVANDDAFSGTLGGFVGGNVLANDTDLNNDPLSASLISGPSYASNFTLNPDGSFVYTHNGTANFSDSFDYSASDGALNDTATVSITLGAISISITLDKAGPAGSENSRVFTIPAGIDCGNGCPSQTAVFAVTQTISLVAQPAFGFLFDSWSGDADCTDASLQPIGNRSCTANFVADPGASPQSVQVTISKAGAGSGVVISDPAGVDCGATCPLQTATVPTTAQLPRVKLLARAVPGSVFAGFSDGPGCPDLGVLDCGCADTELDGDLPASCTATFNLAPRTLTITFNGAGSIAGDGIQCTGNPCSASYSDGTLVTVSGSSDTSRDPNDVSWGGDCSSDTTFQQKATVLMSSNRNCTVTFN